MTTDEFVGQQVHLALWRGHLSQREVAESLGMTEAALSRKLRGGRKWTLDELLRVARLLDVPVGALLPHGDSNTEPAGSLMAVPRVTDRLSAIVELAA